MLRTTSARSPSPPRRGGKRTHDASENGAEWTRETFHFPFIGLDGRPFEVIHSLAYDSRTSAAWNVKVLGLEASLIDIIELAIKTHLEPFLGARVSRGGTANQGGSKTVANVSPAKDNQRAIKKCRQHPPRPDQEDKSSMVDILSSAGGLASPINLAGGSDGDWTRHDGDFQSMNLD